MKKISKYQNSVLTIRTVLAILVPAIILFPHRNVSLTSPNRIVNSKVTKKVAQEVKKVARKGSDLPYPGSKDLQPVGSWKVKSEGEAHPDLVRLNNLWIRVSIKEDRAYIMDGNKLVYTMLASCGVYHNDKSAAPTGTYAVEVERGVAFFNQNLQVDARTYASWHGHGTCLFHSVPADGNNRTMEDEAEKLDKTQASHGYIRLSIPDSKWLYEELPVGTKAVVKDK